jgi:hypothetical protein
MKPFCLPKQVVSCNERNFIYFISGVRIQEIVGKWLVIVQKIWYYTRRSHRERLESFAMPQTLQAAWTRLERHTDAIWGMVCP